MRPHADRHRAFQHIYETCYRPVAAYALRRVPADEADDVVAETFLVAWRRLDDMPHGDESLPWLYGVARRVISDRLRSRRRRDRLFARLVRFRDPDDVTIADATAFDERNSVHRALARLRPDDQELLRLSEWEQLRPPELAVIYDCTANAAAIRVHRARRRFGEALRTVEAELAEGAEQGPAR